MNIILKAFFCIAVYLSWSEAAYARYCVAAADFGLGGVVYVKANPNEGSSGPTELIQETPRDRQYAKWNPAGLYTIGNAVNPKTGKREPIKMKAFVSGSWYPWGGVNNSQSCPIGGSCGDAGCTLVPCDKNISDDATCLEDGQKVSIDPNSPDFPCMLKNGVGLYGLVAVNGPDGKSLDPNIKENALSLQPEYFRTFHMTPLKDSNSGEKYYELEFTQTCRLNSSGITECVKDYDSDGNQAIKRGSLYFQIRDRHYDDNTGFYTINIVSGVYLPKGLLEQAIESFETSIKKVTARLYSSLTEDLKFIKIVRALLVLYVAFTGIAFMLGMLRIHQSELFIRLFKVGLVTTVISEGSWDFFNEYLFALFTDTAKYIAAEIVKATLYVDGNLNVPIFIMPENATALAAYDIFLKMLVSVPVLAKTSALFLTKYTHFFLAIIVCIFIMIFAILHSVLMYILAVIQVAMLLVMSPIFIIMMLFQLTKSLFDEWLRQLMSCGFLVILVMTTIALMLTISLDLLQKLLYFDICWNHQWWQAKIQDNHLFYVAWWDILNASQVETALTLINLVTFIIVSLVFASLIEEIPMIADTLTNSSRQAFSRIYKDTSGGFQGSALGQLPKQVWAMSSPLGLAIDQPGSPEQGKLSKLAEGIRFVRNIPTTIDQKLHSDTLGTGKNAQRHYEGLLPDADELENEFEQKFKKSYDKYNKDE